MTIEALEPTADYAPECGKDDDTCASYIAWKLESELASQTHKITSDLLEPLCKFTQEEIRHQLQQQSLTVRLPGLQAIKERDLEM